MTQLISDLSDATNQMKQASLVDDWTLVERIQKRRAALLEQLVELAAEAPLSESEAEQLRSVRQLETEVASRAVARRQATGEALKRQQAGRPPKRKSRMQEAYEAPKRKR
ncbi:hypothetical protein G3480_12195 [Thiorhodococcus mannitoliphagus]|uniref:Protein FliT n=1 Tax=Thiorhodococcus mannitoliphagus TaxID=329406 RepID=A0A6P1DV30_9GAMM|nr:hypothetical protein [Thiorhodococcus mannitoliphagus]NEX21063.1 hypothetical protein [Thiorhodococcus mannitoliphagus]